MSKLLNLASLTFIATVVGLAIPVWLWRADLNAKSLSLQLASQTPLTSDSASSIKGLEVLMDGVKVATPMLSVVTLRNDGKKPITTAEFEAPVEVRVATGSRIVRAEVTASKPADLEAKITWDSTSVRFTPVLMNPEEAVTVSILTEGKQPTFASRARVVGVSTVGFIDTTKKAPTWIVSGAMLVGAILLFIASDIVDPSLRGGPAVLYVRKRAAIFIKGTCSFAGLLAYVGFAISVELDGIWAMVGGLLPTLVVTALLGTALNAGAKSKAAATMRPNPLQGLPTKSNDAAR